MLDTSFLGSVRNILALAELDLIFGALPVVGDEKDGVGSLDSLCDRGFVAQIGLFTIISSSLELSRLLTDFISTPLSVSA